VLRPDAFRHYVEAFNRTDRETVVNHIPNAAAWDWMAENVPLLDCPDKDIEEIYYFRWWTYRKHLKQTPAGFVVTEFLPHVGWSKQFNTINHSTYCDLIISGLIGLRPRADDLIEVNPLVPEGTWDSFCLDGVSCHGRNLTILYDKSGQRYGKGQGLQVLVDGRQVAHGDTLQRVTCHLP